MTMEEHWNLGKRVNVLMTDLIWLLQKLDNNNN